MKFSKNEDEAAVIIQKCVRRFLRTHNNGQNGAIKSSLIITDNVDENDNNLEGISSNNQISLQLQGKKILEQVNLFYKKLYSNSQKKEEIKKLCASIDEVSSNLKAIRNLHQCKDLETSFSGVLNVDQVKKRHQEQIRQINLRWWEKLDIYDSP